jgi:hypothetical protein
VLARKINDQDAKFWAPILGGKVLFINRERGVLGGKVDGIDLKELEYKVNEAFSIDALNLNYYKCNAHFNETVHSCLFIEKKEMWRTFHRLKNKLLLIGASLAIFGMILGPFFSFIFARQLKHFLQTKAQVQGAFSEDILIQIESLKKRASIK